MDCRILVALLAASPAFASSRLAPLTPAPVALAAPAALALPAAAALLPVAAAPLAEMRPMIAAVSASVVPVAPTEISQPGGPEEFALRARALFEGVRRAESSLVRPDGVATDDEISGRMNRLPTTNPEREKYMVDLFKLAGARAEDVVLQDVGRGRHNIMVVKKGRTDRVLVVGGHHDKVREGAGSIDNGTGATMVANLYQALKDLETEATIVFIAFAREEEGLLGSAAYLGSLAPSQKSKIDAMVNLDTLAVDGTFSWQNNSTPALLQRVREVARTSGHAVAEAHLDGGDADSSSFRAAQIPAITIYGASQDVIFEIIHSGRDTMAAFSLAHYRNAYLLTMEFLKSLDAAPLGPVGPEQV
jgi:hypothetical protein